MRQYHHRQLPAKHHGFDRALTIFFVFAERLVLALCTTLACSQFTVKNRSSWNLIAIDCMCAVFKYGTDCMCAVFKYGTGSDGQSGAGLPPVLFVRTFLHFSFSTPF